MSSNLVERSVDETKEAMIHPSSFIDCLKQNEGLRIPEYIQSQNISVVEFFEQLPIEQLADYLIEDHPKRKKRQFSWRIINEFFETEGNGDLLEQDIYNIYSKMVTLLDQSKSIFFTKLGEQLLIKNQFPIVVDIFSISVKYKNSDWFVDVLEKQKEMTQNPIDLTIIGEKTDDFCECPEILVKLVRKKIIIPHKDWSGDMQWRLFKRLLGSKEKVNVELAIEHYPHMPDHFCYFIERPATEAMLEANWERLSRLLDKAYQNPYTQKHNPFRHLLPLRLNQDKEREDLNGYFNLLLNQYADWFEPLIIEIYADYISRGEKIDYLAASLAAWPKERGSLFIKIFRLPSLLETFSDLKSVESWAQVLTQIFDGHVPHEVWQEIYEYDLARQQSLNFRLFCSHLQFYIITKHRDAIPLVADADIHVSIIQYIKDEYISGYSESSITVDFSVSNFLKNETLPAKYRYFLLAELPISESTVNVLINDLSLGEQAGFSVSKPYQLKQCKVKIAKSLESLQQNAHRLSAEGLEVFKQACERFDEAFTRYKNNEIDHTALFKSLIDVFNEENVKPILETHSEWYNALLDIAMNILIIGSIIGLIALAGYRTTQGFQHGFFIHRETTRERLMKDLEVNTQSLPGGKVFDF